MPAVHRAAIAACLLLGACAVPDIDRHTLHAERLPASVEGARGPLSAAERDRLFAAIERKSPGTDLLGRHQAVEEALAGNPLSAGNQVTLLEDGPATYAAMLQAIDAARHHVHLEVYIMEDDEVGRRFAERLVARRRAGVEVRLVFDAVGSMRTPREFFLRMVDAGVEVIEFNPVTPGTVLAKGLALNRRNHRKLTIVDGRVAFLGGINISSVYTSGSSGSGTSGRADPPFEERPWRDTQVRIEGPVVADFQRSFAKMWSQLEKKPPLAGAAYFPPLPRRGPHLVRAVEGWLDTGLNPLYVTLISAIESAQTRVRITMAYFVPHDELLEALEAAARRGVRVELILPSRSDHWLVQAAARSYYQRMLDAGIRIHERKTRLLHAKTATIDGVWSTVGSTNLDWRSLLHNDEINAVVLGAEFAQAMDRAFERDLAASEAITLERWASRPFQDRLREATARAWARLL